MPSGRCFLSCSITRLTSMFDLFRGNPTPGLSSPMSRRAFTFTAGALAVSGMMRPGGLAAQGQQRLEVVPGGTAAIPIAIPNFAAGTPSDGEAGVNVAQVITNNLRRSGLFAPIDQAAYIEKTINIDAAPQFQNWKTINAQRMLTGRMTRQPDERRKQNFTCETAPPASRSPDSNISPRQNIGGGSRTAFPTRSTSI